jgi:protein-disulfide isomerase
MMKRIGYLLLGVFTVAAVSACEARQSSKVDEKLDAILTRLDKLEQNLQRGAGAARQRPQRPSEPDPSKVFAVPVAGAPAEGPANAKVTIVKAFEFACPYCQRVVGTLDQLRKDYGDDVRIVYENYIVHPDAATTPALAACAAHKQGKYEPMKKLIWEKGFNANRNLSRENMDALAAEAGLDVNRYKADIDGEECKKMVQQEHSTLANFGVRGTPAFFINGRYLSGAQPIQNFKRVIDEELKKANERIQQGTKPEDYYAKFVLEQGLKKFEP